MAVMAVAVAVVAAAVAAAGGGRGGIDDRCRRRRRTTRRRAVEGVNATTSTMTKEAGDAASAHKMLKQ